MKRSEFTPEEYDRRFNEAVNVAAGGANYYWNERFRSALDKRGLTLAIARHPHDSDERYPRGYPMQAPNPFPGSPDPWPISALMVWKQEA